VLSSRNSQTPKQTNWEQEIARLNLDLTLNTYHKSSNNKGRINLITTAETQEKVILMMALTTPTTTTGIT